MHHLLLLNRYSVFCPWREKESNSCSFDPMSWESCTHPVSCSFLSSGPLLWWHWETGLKQCPGRKTWSRAPEGQVKAFALLVRKDRDSQVGFLHRGLQFHLSAGLLRLTHPVLWFIMRSYGCPREFPWDVVGLIKNWFLEAKAPEVKRRLEKRSRKLWLKTCFFCLGQHCKSLCWKEQ